MKQFRNSLLLAVMAIGLLCSTPAKAEDIFSGTTNVVLIFPQTNVLTGSTSSTFTNIGYQGIGSLTLISTNIAGTTPSLTVTLQGGGDGTTFTNIATYSLVTYTNRTIGSIGIPMQEVPPYIRTTNWVQGSSAQYSYSVSLAAPLKYKQ